MYLTHIRGDPEGRRQVPDTSVITIIINIKRHTPTDHSHYRMTVSCGRDRLTAITSIVQNNSKLGKISPRWWWSKRDRTDLSGRTAAPERGLRCCRWVFTMYNLAPVEYYVVTRAASPQPPILKLQYHFNATVFPIASNLHIAKLKEALLRDQFIQFLQTSYIGLTSTLSLFLNELSKPEFSMETLIFFVVLCNNNGTKKKIIITYKYKSS